MTAALPVRGNGRTGKAMRHPAVAGQRAVDAHLQDGANYAPESKRSLQQVSRVSASTAPTAPTSSHTKAAW